VSESITGRTASRAFDQLPGQLPRQLHQEHIRAVQQPSSQFDWRAAGVGATGMLGLILLLTAVKTGT
jgi:hypothetical protein